MDPDVVEAPSVRAMLDALRSRGTRKHAGARLYTPPGPSLPPLDDPQEPLPAPSSFPSTPRSWIASSTPSITAEWRARALSLVLQHSPAQSPALAVPADPRMPSLLQLCLRKIIELGGIPPDLFRTFPRHILREYARYVAVHAPDLPLAHLEALCDVEGACSADGELIVSGQLAPAVLPRLAAASALPAVANDWDTLADTAYSDPPPVLHTLVLLMPSGALPTNLITLFPPTLTHLAMLHVPPIGLHRLPRQLPLLEVLDLSSNDWIARSTATARVEWGKWTHLRVLGLRDCGIVVRDLEMLKVKVNRGRLKDVEIVGSNMFESRMYRVGYSSI